ncbi:hypothetical protein [Thiolapillus sp.]
MKNALIAVALLSFSSFSIADTLPFDISIKGKSFAINKSLKLSDIGEGRTKTNFDFQDNNGNKYNFDLKYVKLPDNRSYPGNLDITIRDADGKKLGYLFLANNGVQALKKLGVFGLILDIDGEAVDIQFRFDADKKGTLRVAQLGEERFVQDTLVPKFSFQMIRPVILPETEPGIRSISYKLDNHPYAINYSLLDRDNGMVEFQHNLYDTQGNSQHLLERIYFMADSMETLREAMYAGKYFHKTDGTFKLVFYPAMGQTEPPK